MNIRLPILLIVIFVLTTSAVYAKNSRVNSLLDVNAVNGVLFLNQTAPWFDPANYTENTILNDVPFNWNVTTNSGVNLTAINITGGDSFYTKLLNVTVGTDWAMVGSTTFDSKGAAYVVNISNQTEKHFIRLQIIGSWTRNDRFKCSSFSPGNVYCNGTGRLLVEDLSGRWQCFVRNLSPPFNYLNNSAYCFQNTSQKIFLNTLQFNISSDFFGIQTVYLHAKANNTDILTKVNMTVTKENRVITNP